MSVDTLWFRSRPSDRANPIPREAGVSREGSTVLYHQGRPDHFVVPPEVEHPSAGERARVIDRKIDRCPLPDHDHECVHSLLDTAAPALCVAACEMADKWVVYWLGGGE